MKALFTTLEIDASQYKVRAIVSMLYTSVVNPIQFRMVEKRPPTSFPPVTSTNEGINLQNSLTVSFNTIATLMSNFKVIPSASPKLLNLNQDHLSKKVVFRVKSL